MPLPLAAPAQKFSSDKTRIVPVAKTKKVAAVPLHPAAKTAAESWARLHGTKFHANAHKNKK